VFPPWVVSGAIIGFTFAIVLPILYARLRTKGGGGPLTRPYLTAGAAILLAGIVAVAALHVLGGSGGGFPTVNSGGGSNSSKGVSTNNSTSNLSPVGGPGGVLAPFKIQLPSWSLFVLVSIAAIAVVIAGLPPLADYLQDRRENRNLRSRSAEVAALVQRALKQTALDLEGGLDPRATILALYATLLIRIEPLAMNLDRSTPEEIRQLHLTRLGIRAPAAQDLTRVFEEARYSSHPLGPEQATRAAAAIRAAEEDLARMGATE